MFMRCVSELVIESREVSDPRLSRNTIQVQCLLTEFFV